MKVKNEGPEEIVTVGPKKRLEKVPFQFATEAQSTITFGGYRTDDYEDPMTWYDTTECIGAWNITAEAFAMGSTSLMPISETDKPVVEF